jgi:H+/Cl- antiporter ClcA
MKKHIVELQSLPSIGLYLVKWILLAALVGSLAGSASAFFLVLLDYVTDYREHHLWIIALLPIGGLIIGLVYHYWGNSVVRGNNLIIDEFHVPQKTIPFKMAPMVFFGTILTHLLGGSAGREGTAVQMGGAIADQFTNLFKLNKEDRRILLTMGISAGFASVFGTPIAGAVFALEVMTIGQMRYKSILPSFFAAVIANYICIAWGVGHTHYSIAFAPNINALNLIWATIAGVIFGLTAFLFSKSTHFWNDLFSSKIKYAPLRPLVGGLIIALAIWLMGTTKYIGLGIPVIVDAFNIPLNSYDFLLKILFTSFTLGAGFKGGEVTPLFYIGAALGNALVWFIPLPVSLLAGMGFVAVFAGAANTPIACILMGIELFGAESAVYIAIACVVAYLFSGHKGIYSAQIIGNAKPIAYNSNE